MRAADGTGSCCASPGRSARGSRRPSMRRRTGQAPAAAKEAVFEFADAGPCGNRVQVEQHQPEFALRCVAARDAVEIGAPGRQRRPGEVVEHDGGRHVAQRIEILPEIRRDPHLPLPCPIGLLMCATTPIDYSDRLFDGPRCRNGRQPHPFERCTARCCSAARRATAQRRVRAAHHGFSTPFICTTVRRFSRCGHCVATTPTTNRCRTVWRTPRDETPLHPHGRGRRDACRVQRCRARAVESHAVRRARRRRAIPDACRRAPLGRSTAELRHPAFPDRDERSRGSRRRLACAVQARTGPQPQRRHRDRARLCLLPRCVRRHRGAVGTVTLGRQFSVLFDKTLFYDPLWYASYSGRASSCR